jgi:hypothetical protein
MNDYVTRHVPVTVSWVYSPRPPYNVPDRTMEQDLQRGETCEAWVKRLHAARMDALVEQMPADLTDRERGFLEWLVGWETETVAIVASLLYRARQEGHTQGVIDTLLTEGEFLKKKSGDVDNNTMTARRALSIAGTGMVRRGKRRSNSTN